MALQGKARIVFDTNMLLAIGQFKVDVFSEAKKMFGEADFVVPKQVKEELHDLSKKGLSLKKAAGIALREMQANNVEVERVEAVDADQALEKMAGQGWLIATNDGLLRKRIKGFGGKVIYLRQGHFLKTG